MNHLLPALGVLVPAASEKQTNQDHARIEIQHDRPLVLRPPWHQLQKVVSSPPKRRLDEQVGRSKKQTEYARSVTQARTGDVHAGSERRGVRVPPLVPAVDDDVAWLHVLKKACNGLIHRSPGLHKDDDGPAARGRVSDERRSLRRLRRTQGCTSASEWSVRKSSCRNSQTGSCQALREKRAGLDQLATFPSLTGPIFVPSFAALLTASSVLLDERLKTEMGKPFSAMLRARFCKGRVRVRGMFHCKRRDTENAAHLAHHGQAAETDL